MISPQFFTLPRPHAMDPIGDRRGAHAPQHQKGLPQLRRQRRLRLGLEGGHAPSVAAGQEDHVAGGEFLKLRGSYVYIFTYLQEGTWNTTP